jgi:hypothetical protein
MATVLTPPHTNNTPSLTESVMLRPSNPLRSIYEQILAGERVSREDALVMLETNDLLGLGILADTARILRTPVEQRDYVYWIHNYHINISGPSMKLLSRSNNTLISRP